MPAAENKPESNPASRTCWLCGCVKSVVHYIGSGEDDAKPRRPRVARICPRCDNGSQMFRYTRPPEALP